MKRVMICIILLSSLLFGCGKTSTEEPKPTQGEQRPVFTGTITPSAAPTPSIDPKASPTLTPIPDGKLLGWRLVESWIRINGEVTTEKHVYDEAGHLVKLEKQIKDDITSKTEIMEYQYDEQGNCVSERKSDNIGNISVVTFRYEDRKLAERRYYMNDSSDSLYSIVSYQYLEDGSVRRELRDPDSNALESYTILRYDEEGRIIESRFYTEMGGKFLLHQSYQAEYCEHGLLWSREERNLLTHGADTDNYPEYEMNVYLYDGDGNVLKKVRRGGALEYESHYREEWIYRYERGELVYEAYLDDYNIIQRQEEWRCIFDEDGRVLEKIRLNEDGTDTSHKKTYRYDDYGNCIEMIEQQGARKDVYRYVYEPVFAAD